MSPHGAVAGVSGDLGRTAPWEGFHEGTVLPVGRATQPPLAAGLLDVSVRAARPEPSSGLRLILTHAEEVGVGGAVWAALTGVTADAGLRAVHGGTRRAGNRFSRPKSLETQQGSNGKEKARKVNQNGNARHWLRKQGTSRKVQKLGELREKCTHNKEGKTPAGLASRKTQICQIRSEN